MNFVLICIKINIQLMYNILQHAHSGLMWLVIAMLLVSILFGMLKLATKDETFSMKWFGLFKYTKHLLYLQFLLGLALYFLSPKVHFVSGFMKNEELRFYGMEHPLMMLIAVGLVAWGLFKSKKKPNVLKKLQTITIYYAIAFIVIMKMIPWEAVLA